MGESGSGKSTVARCIARLIDPTERQDLPRRHRDRHHVGRQAAPAPPPRADRLPGSLPLDEPAHHRRRLDHRGADELRPHARRGAGPRAQADGDRAARSQFARPLSAPVLRRPAPAHLHRPRARHGARAADRRRGGLGARRVGAEAGAGAARRDPPAAESRRAVHHPRSARRRADLRLRRGDEQGPRRRVRLGRAGVRLRPRTTTPRRCSPPPPAATGNSASSPRRDRLPAATKEKAS